MKIDELNKLSEKFRQPMTPERFGLMKEYLRQLGLDPDNLYQELEMSERYVQMHQDTTYFETASPLHSHTFYEILCCRNSSGVEYLVGTERYRLQKGDIVFVSPGVSHRPLLPGNMPEPYIRDVLWLSPDFIQLLKQLFPDPGIYRNNESSLLRTAGTQWEYVGELLREAIAESERREPGWQIVAMGKAMGFLTHLTRAFQDVKSVSMEAEKPELLDQVMAYIEANLARKITLEDVARSFFVSESTISQTFRKKMGVSFYRCVTQRRLIGAKSLILAGVTLEDVARQVGFSDYSAFYRAFRQEYGISPRRYRSLQSGGGKPQL